MRAVDRQAAGARVRRSNSRATRPASAINTASQVMDMPPRGEAPPLDAPLGAAGEPGSPIPRGEATERETSSNATVAQLCAESSAAAPVEGDAPRALDPPAPGIKRESEELDA